jgi:hypothetical protein
MKKITTFSFMVVLAVSSFAHTGGNIEYTCPICKTKFEAYTQSSGTSFGRNLDLRRYGAIMIPAPIPKCTNCNFVFDDDFFTKEEINKLKMEFKNNNIFIKEPNMPNYYYLARECEILNRNLEDIIWFFLSSVWENENEAKKNILINITINNIDKLNKASSSYYNYQLVKLDLLRRSGQFSEALALTEEIKTNKDFYKEYIVEIINLQIKLISERNQDEHPLP